MTPHVVVDIGNSRMKWGICCHHQVTQILRLPLDEADAWRDALAQLSWSPAESWQWAVASVNPHALERFLAWLPASQRVVVFDDFTALPIRLNVAEPQQVGLDRLLGCIAAIALTPAATATITVDIGTAVTVNCVDAVGVFQGGAIFPGPRLMGRALHAFTAKLPLVDLTEPPLDPFPGRSTLSAIRHGIRAALWGGVDHAVQRWVKSHSCPVWLYVTGGGAGLLADYEPANVQAIHRIPALTLEGIRIAAETRP
ncbi:MAG: type III pantothenate kinase [Gemmataceae bacterium]|nr:type III pantothenate kinase [Gemmata sp.]MDW8199096.1 type III pantothenate kinase [Gemmataceae bacterium]